MYLLQLVPCMAVGPSVTPQNTLAPHLPRVEGWSVSMAFPRSLRGPLQLAQVAQHLVPFVFVHISFAPFVLDCGRFRGIPFYSSLVSFATSSSPL